MKAEGSCGGHEKSFRPAGLSLTNPTPVLACYYSFDPAFWVTDNWVDLFVGFLAIKVKILRLPAAYTSGLINMAHK